MYCTVSEINAANPKIIKLSKTDNVCQFGYGIECSAVGLGTYELTTTILTLTFEQGHVYVFNVVGDDMVFDADKSSTPVVEDGTVYAVSPLSLLYLRKAGASRNDKPSIVCGRKNIRK